MEIYEKIKTIVFGGGCFWGTQQAFKLLNGVIKTQVGYANGNTDKTEYQNLSVTEHAEVVKITYDANKIRLAELIDRFFLIIDPFTLNQQGNDVGRQYRTGIYYENDEDLKIINLSMEVRRKLYDKKIYVEVEKLKNYVTAEPYHQNYLEKYPSGYCHINPNDILKPLWSDNNFIKPSDEEIKKQFGSDVFYISQEKGTEYPFTSKYNDENQVGIYVDLISKEPLFSSIDKFDAGCGWPSFTRPITTDRLDEYEDTSHSMIRTEVRSKIANSHLGHVFNDGPVEKGMLRYCINGAVLEFIPLSKMEEKGYLLYIPYVYQ